MPLIQIIKDCAQIKMRSLIAQIQLPLHRQVRSASFRLVLFFLLPMLCSEE